MKLAASLIIFTHVDREYIFGDLVRLGQWRIQELRSWLEEQVPQVNPQHPWPRAPEYTLSEWDCLLAYVCDGALDIADNMAERSLRGIALAEIDSKIRAQKSNLLAPRMVKKSATFLAT